jgi:hypothetical protein
MGLLVEETNGQRRLSTAYTVRLAENPSYFGDIRLSQKPQAGLLSRRISGVSGFAEAAE